MPLDFRSWTGLKKNARDVIRLSRRMREFFDRQLSARSRLSELGVISVNSNILGPTSVCAFVILTRNDICKSDDFLVHIRYENTKNPGNGVLEFSKCKLHHRGNCAARRYKIAQ